METTYEKLRDEQSGDGDCFRQTTEKEAARQHGNLAATAADNGCSALFPVFFVDSGKGSLLVLRRLGSVRHGQNRCFPERCSVQGCAGSMYGYQLKSQGYRHDGGASCPHDAGQAACSSLSSAWGNGLKAYFSYRPESGDFSFTQDKKYVIIHGYLKISDTAMRRKVILPCKFIDVLVDDLSGGFIAGQSFLPGLGFDENFSLVHRLYGMS